MGEVNIFLARAERESVEPLNKSATRARLDAYRLDDRLAYSGRVNWVKLHNTSVPLRMVEAPA